MELSREQIERYSRQIILPGFGGKGQEKLLQARVLLIGAGGLGSPCALYLAAAGVGTIGIVDSDKVELDNLQRQILHFVRDLGRPKVESARRCLGTGRVPYWAARQSLTGKRCPSSISGGENILNVRRRFSPRAPGFGK